jgi:hypothetical protein
MATINRYFSRMGSALGDTVPFEIVPWTGQGSGYMVTDGVCFSTFSFDTGSFIPIENLNQRFDFKQNEKFYIDFSVSQNLQVTGAKIQCSFVGGDREVSSIDRSNPIVWENYPNMIYIQPEDEFDEEGRVVRITDGKRQLRCYVLIGYRSDDTSKNGAELSEEGRPPSLPEGGSEGVPVQILQSNLILLASMYSGVPIIFPVPYLNGLEHLQSLQEQPPAEEESSGNGSPSGPPEEESDE